MRSNFDSFPNEIFRFNAGQLLINTAGKLSAHSHHWLTHHEELAAEPSILDITPDQFEGVQDKVIVEPLGKLALSGLYYLAYEQYDNPPAVLKDGLPGSSAQERANLILTAVGLEGSVPHLD
jgi:hypothetical protein